MTAADLAITVSALTAAAMLATHLYLFRHVYARRFFYRGRRRAGAR